MHFQLKAYQIYSNDDPKLTLTSLWKGQFDSHLQVYGENIEKLIFSRTIKGLFIIFDKNNLSTKKMNI